MYACDDVLYRSTFYEDAKVYEIVSDPSDEVGGAAGTDTNVVGMGLTDPMASGDTVRDLQNRLVEAGYDVGGADGTFGSGTETALMWYQYDKGLQPTGIVDMPTAQALGFVPPSPAIDPAGEPPVDPTAPVNPAVPPAPADPAVCSTC